MYIKLLELRNIEKKYEGNPVLKGVSLSLEAGEIHAVVGENGAGKSTLMNILFGMPVIHSTGGFTGEIRIDQKPVSITSPFSAMKHGIGMVHQEFMLIPELAVYENIKLNRELTKKNPASFIFGKKLESLNRFQMRRDSEIAMNEAGLKMDVEAIVSGLPLGHMQFIEIAREVDKRGTKILVFDEPTAVLTESEALILLQTMMRLAKDHRYGILFITHRLDEVFQVADTITVLRDGEKVITLPKKDLTVNQLAELMVSRKMEADFSKKIKPEALPILEFKNFSVNMPGEEVQKINFDVIRCEILGIGGLAGGGKLGIANGIAGLYPASGDVIKNGKKIRLNSPHDFFREKMAFLSEDRKTTGLLLDDTIESNACITAMMAKNSFFKFGFADRKSLKKYADEMIQKLSIKCVSGKQLVKKLSGGNQQKVAIAKMLALNPEIIFVSEPTRGIDVGAKKLILNFLMELNERENVTIIMTSSELAELRSVCNRIMIVSKGKIAGVLPPNASDVEYGLMMGM